MKISNVEGEIQSGEGNGGHHSYAFSNYIGMRTRLRKEVQNADLIPMSDTGHSNSSNQRDPLL